MPVLSADHLFEQAEKLILPPAAGPPRQVDVRRAISAAYYGLFHATLTAAADQIIGFTLRASPLYALVYRSIDHQALRNLCQEAQRLQPSSKYAKVVPAGGFGANIQSFAGATIELREKRHAADYDPSVRVKTLDARVAIATARTALLRFHSADPEMRRVFLTLLLFSPR